MPQIKLPENFGTYPEARKKPSRPRILISGCPTHGVIDKVIKRIEELGAFLELLG